MNKKNFIKLARLVAKFAEVNTDKGILIFDGDLTEGVEVVTEDGEAVADGEYALEDGRVLVVTESKVTEIREPEVPAEPAAEPEAELEEETPAEPESALEPTDDKEAEYIAELEAKIAEYEATIEALQNRIKELEDAAEAPVEDGVELSAVAQSKKTEKIGALKYFA